MTFADNFMYAGVLAGSSALYAAYKAKRYYDRMKPMNKLALRGALSSLKKNKLMAPVSRKRKTVIETNEPTKRRKLASNRKSNKSRSGRSRKSDRKVYKTAKKLGMPGYFAGKFKRATKKSSKAKIDKMYMENGVLHKEERAGITTTTSEAVYVGHATHPTRLMVQLFWKCVAKKLFQKMGLFPASPENGFPMDAADQILINFKILNGSTASSGTTPATRSPSITLQLTATQPPQALGWQLQTATRSWSGRMVQTFTIPRATESLERFQLPMAAQEPP